MGSVARGDYDIASDVDLLIPLKREIGARERVKIRAEIWRVMDELGVPWTIPYEFHIVGPEKAKIYFKDKVIKLD